MKEMEITSRNLNNLIPTTSRDSTYPFFPLWRQFREHYPPQIYRKVVAETIATCLRVFVTCGSAALSATDETRVSQLGASIAGGLIVTVMIYAVGHISGAFMNPAVTVAFASIGHLPWKQVPLYAAAQFTGAISAGFTLRVLLHPIKRLGTTSPSGSQIQSLIMEIVVTFSMMFIASAVTIDAKATSIRWIDEPGKDLRSSNSQQLLQRALGVLCWSSYGNTTWGMVIPLCLVQRQASPSNQLNEQQ
ncbi:aquaporin NIP2-1-like isoform X2 [Rhododendron vialii]|uniref:aquaporin NIP2-1-like isoform X2 n=1 Tax=Rhododendron vialii TaxID=182163 RepID=UPI00265EE5D6|nr:aquaporin NIP2-1-like isoform X2 [Rhododendron vialii]